MNVSEMFGFGEQDEVFKKDNTEALKALGDAARSCVNTKEFKNYKNQLEDTKLVILDQLAAMKPQGSLEQYGMQVMIYLDRYKTLKRLVDTIETDAKKGKE